MAPLFEEITVASPDVTVVVDKRHEAEQLRELRADAIVLLTNSFRTAWVSRQAGIPQRWGYRAHARSLLLTRAFPAADPGPSVRVLPAAGARAGSRRCAGQTRSPRADQGLDPGSDPQPVSAARPLRIYAERPAPAPTPFSRSSASTARRPLVGFAPGAAYGHAKRWPPTRVAELVARLSAGGATCLLVGAQGDRDAGREIESALPPGTRVVNLIGRTDLRLLAGLLASCHGFVSNDSGAMHLAAAAGVPVAAIFGPTDERVTAPLGDHDVIIHQVFCRPCMLRDCPIDHRCMRGISVDTVFDAVHARRARRRERAVTARDRAAMRPRASSSIATARCSKKPDTSIGSSASSSFRSPSTPSAC